LKAAGDSKRLFDRSSHRIAIRDHADLLKDVVDKARVGPFGFQSPGGSPPFRSVLEHRDHSDGGVNVVSIANRTAHVFVAKPYVGGGCSLS